MLNAAPFMSFKDSLKRAITQSIALLGLQISKIRKDSSDYPIDFESRHVEACERVKPYTLTSKERIYSMISAVEYICRFNISGAIVECGVWRGGSAMAAAVELLRIGESTRDIYLYDTFAGMPEPSLFDESSDGKAAINRYNSSLLADGSSDWCRASLEDVTQNMLTTGYPMEKIHFIRGAVEKTIPKTVPDQIALLRLDTDWYESTLHELEFLFPRLQKHGILIVDDYGHWKGARRAVDEYLSKNNVVHYLSRIDYSCRLIVKL